MGTSPEIPCGQSPAWPRVFRASSSGRRAERGVAPEDPRGEPLEEEGLVGGDPQVTERAPRVRRGEREGPGRRAGVPVPLRQRQRRLPAGGHPGGERHAGHAPGCEPDPLAQADDGVEQDPGGAGERSAVERLRVGRAASAPQEAGPVGLPLDRPLGPPILADDVQPPGRQVVGRARPPVAEERGARRDVLRSRRRACRTPGAPGRRPAGPGRSRRSSSPRISRVRSLWFVTTRRRTSTSSSGETATSSWVPISSSRRWKVARSAAKVTR